jgi:hypothetical protein
MPYRGRAQRMKHLAELTIDDLLDCAVWQFDLRQKFVKVNEGSVRPRPKLTPRERQIARALFVVRTKFVLADGTGSLGYCVPSRMPVAEETLLGYVQPAIVTERGRVPFWFGGLMWVDGRGRQRGKDLADSEVGDLYWRLGRSEGAVFPVRFESEVELLPEEIGSGVIPGFGYLRSTPQSPPQGYAKHGDEVIWVR